MAVKSAPMAKIPRGGAVAGLTLSRTLKGSSRPFDQQLEEIEFFDTNPGSPKKI